MLTQTLYRLAETNKIRRPWVEGMKVLDTKGQETRLLAIHHSGEALGTCGPLSIIPLSAGFLSSARPDTSDSATVGCLLSLLREAQSDEDAYTIPVTQPKPGRRWAVHSIYWREPVYGETEAEAIVAALVRAAEGA